MFKLFNEIEHSVKKTNYIYVNMKRFVERFKRSGFVKSRRAAKYSCNGHSQENIDCVRANIFEIIIS